MLEDDEDFGDASIADDTTRDSNSSSSSSPPILGSNLSSNGNGEVPLQSN